MVMALSEPTTISAFVLIVEVKAMSAVQAVETWSLQVTAPQSRGSKIV